MTDHGNYQVKIGSHQPWVPQLFLDFAQWLTSQEDGTLGWFDYAISLDSVEWNDPDLDYDLLEDNPSRQKRTL